MVDSSNISRISKYNSCFLCDALLPGAFEMRKDLFCMCRWSFGVFLCARLEAEAERARNGLALASRRQRLAAAGSRAWRRANTRTTRASSVEQVKRSATARHHSYIRERAEVMQEEECAQIKPVV
jgi:hypothetical protein